MDEARGKRRIFHLTTDEREKYRDLLIYLHLENKETKPSALTTVLNGYLTKLTAPISYTTTREWILDFDKKNPKAEQGDKRNVEAEMVELAAKIDARIRGSIAVVKEEEKQKAYALKELKAKAATNLDAVEKLRDDELARPVRNWEVCEICRGMRGNMDCPLCGGRGIHERTVNEYQALQAAKVVGQIISDLTPKKDHDAKVLIINQIAQTPEEINQRAKAAQEKGEVVRVVRFVDACKGGKVSE